MLWAIGSWTISIEVILPTFRDACDESIEIGDIHRSCKYRQLS